MHDNYDVHSIEHVHGIDISEVGKNYYLYAHHSKNLVDSI